MVATVEGLRSSAMAVTYYERDGYYARNDPEHRQASFWYGDAAQALGLKAHVRPSRFESVLSGYVPGTDLRLGRMREGEHEHRPGWDITLSAPKSVSLEALVMGDRRVIRAHDEAVRATLDFVEAELLQTRGWDPATRRRPRVSANGMVMAGFRHLASRDQDPQLHTHCVLANMTRTASGEWRSVEPTKIRRSQKLIGAYYRNELARRLQALGMAVSPRPACRWSAQRTRQLKAVLSATVNKSDRNDARGIAQMVRVNMIRPVHVKTVSSQEKRMLLTNRKFILKQLCDAEANIRGTLRNFGLKVGQVGRGRFEARICELVEDRAALAGMVAPMLRARAELLTTFNELHKMVLVAVRADPVCRRMMTIPGVGPVTALTFRATVDVPARFACSRAVGAHFGLTPRRWQSGRSTAWGGSPNAATRWCARHSTRQLTSCSRERRGGPG